MLDVWVFVQVHRNFSTNSQPRRLIQKCSMEFDIMNRIMAYLRVNVKIRVNDRVKLGLR